MIATSNHITKLGKNSSLHHARCIHLEASQNWFDHLLGDQA